MASKDKNKPQGKPPVPQSPAPLTAAPSNPSPQNAPSVAHSPINADAIGRAVESAVKKSIGRNWKQNLITIIVQTGVLGFVGWVGSQYVEQIKKLQEESRANTIALTDLKASFGSTKEKITEWGNIPADIQKVRSDVDLIAKVYSKEKIDSLENSLRDANAKIQEISSKLSDTQTKNNSTAALVGELSIGNETTAANLAKSIKDIDKLAGEIKKLAETQSVTQVSIVLDVPAPAPSERQTEVQFEIPVSSLATDSVLHSGTVKSIRLHSDKTDFPVTFQSRVSTYSKNILHLKFVFGTVQDAMRFVENVRFQKPQLDVTIDVPTKP